MRKLGLIILLFLLLIAAKKQSPHGEKFNLDCSKCHTEKDWVVDRKLMTFDHNTTKYPLEGQHKSINCRSCHTTLVFLAAQTECSACHQDMHNQTVGFDCARCHTSSTWIIGNVLDIHLQSRFPLIGAHSVADCYRCHPSASALQFNSLGIDCYNCHSDKYFATTNPNHIQVGYSTNCTQCHSEKSYEWTASGFNHDFFPLTAGHSINDCISCHGEGTPGKISSNCNDCHAENYTSAANPNHVQSGFSTNCTDCHTTNIGWKPAEYTQHDSKDFPIYSGRHKNTWDNCAICHENAGDYSSFTCLNCHEHSKTSMDRVHGNRSGYSYESNACYSCHRR